MPVDYQSGHAGQGSLHFTFPDIDPEAQTSVSFVRTLRIPDDHDTHYLPPGLGSFPLRAVEELPNAPERFRRDGGFVFPMYQAEAMWLSFGRGWNSFPVALKIAAGSINAVTGERLEAGLKGGESQDYVALPKQPWLDGFAVEKGKIRQFIAMPLGGGFTVEEQITGAAEFGGIQMIAYPLKKEKWEAIKAARAAEPRSRGIMAMAATAGGGSFTADSFALASNAPSAQMSVTASLESAAMGFGQGGQMKQEIYEDDYSVDDYDLDAGVTAYISVCNSEDWIALTGGPPPYPPPSLHDYLAARLPWFDYYDESPALNGSETLREVKSVNQMLAEQGGETLDDGVPSVGVTVASSGQKNLNG